MKIFDELVNNYPELEGCQVDLEHAFKIMVESFRNGGKLLVCGNGGSASDALHIVGELMKGFMLNRPLPIEAQQKLLLSSPDNGEHLIRHLQGALPAISLVSEVSLISAFANDVDPQMVFAQQVYGLGRPGDVLLAISTSGNAANVVYAVQVAHVFDLRTIGLTGPSGGLMKSLCDATICAPGEYTIAIQERHLPIYHALCLALEQEFFAQGK